MLNDLLTKETVNFIQKVTNWQESIEAAASPLLLNGSITKEYVEAMINTINELGPYIVIAPFVALPHARPKQGVRKLSMSLLIIREAVYFQENAVHVIFVLAAIDNETHLRALSQLCELISDEELIGQMIKIEDKEQILDIILEYTS